MKTREELRFELFSLLLDLHEAKHLDTRVRLATRVEAVERMLNDLAIERRSS